MKKDKKYKIGDIYKWQGIKNSETKTTESGYLFIVRSINKDGSLLNGVGIKIDNVKNRSEAIKKYKLNPINPNNYNLCNNSKNKS